ncbi:MAG: hypothetical protein K5984_06285 [Bacteroidales bacterium]|nr:hypothetical protein [Bacteroidales bacterium]
MIKKTFYALILLLTLSLVGCNDNTITPYEYDSADDVLPGDTLTSGSSIAYTKLFVLNEGTMGQGNASLDFFKFSSGSYVKGAYASMNPFSDGLGDVANNIRLYYNLAFIPVTNSNKLEVMSAYDETHYTSFDIPGCRDVAFNDSYAFVTAYDGASYGNDKIGSVYRINLVSSTSTINSVEVGYQPEGVSLYGQRLYVANSGGYHAGYDNRLSIINTYSFSKITDVEIAPNLKNVYADEENVWVTSFGDYSTVHSGVYCYSAISDRLLDQTDELKNVRFTASYATQTDLYVIGTEDEWDWSGAKRTYKLYSISRREGNVTEHDIDLSEVTTPYAICFNPANSDIYISDVADYTSEGKVFCFNLDSGKKKWTANAGWFPGSMELYGAIY